MTYLVVTLCLLTLLSGCVTGPWQLTKSWDDKTTEWTGHNVWVHGVVLTQVFPIYPIISLFMGLGDILGVNPWYFWSHDAWTNDGTVFIHDQPTGEATVGNSFSGGSSSEWASRNR